VAKVSVVIPARNEKFLAPTVQDALSKAKGDVEVVVHLDGYWPNPPLPQDDRLVLVHSGTPIGMRPGINRAVEVATGTYILKLDGHCHLADGYDEVLKKDCADNWVVVPRRYSLDEDSWARRRGRTPIDYQYLSYYEDVGGTSANDGDRGGKSLHGRNWDEKNRDPRLKEVLIDDLMTAQGSAWFMKRNYFFDLELLDDRSYGTFGNEFQEIGLKCWLSGGSVKVNKNTWYAHLHKGKKHGRGWPLGRHDADQAAQQTRKWIRDGAWDRQTLPFKWLIQKFWPVPDWPEEWAP